jgi:hypothetical protein
MKAEMIDDCDYHSEDEIWEGCDYRGGVCRFKHREKCPDYVSVIDAQIRSDKQQGTNFAETIYGVKSGGVHE